MYPLLSERLAGSDVPTSLKLIFDPYKHLRDFWFYVLQYETTHIIATRFGFKYNPSSFWHRSLAFVGAALVRAVVFHPLRVAQLHYLLLRNERIQVFNSLLEAYKGVSLRSSIYLWTGIAESVVFQTLSAFIQLAAAELSFKLQLRGKWRYPFEITRMLIVEAIISPLRCISTIGMTRTPFFASSRFESFPSGFLNISRHLWSLYGISGFYRGFWPAFFQKVVVHTCASLTVRTTRVVPALLTFIGFTATSFIMDWSQTLVQPEFVVTERSSLEDQFQQRLNALEEHS